MYIDKYWADELKASDDNIKFIDFLLDLDVEEVSLHEIFAKIGLSGTFMTPRAYHLAMSQKMVSR